MEETSKIDRSDRTEYLMSQGNQLATQMMAVENASEMVKRILQAPGVFERIMAALTLECGCIVPMKPHCVNTGDRINRSNNKGFDIIHIGTSVNKTSGHYAGALVNHSNKKIYISDSMGKMGGETKLFTNALSSTFKNYTMSNESFNIGTQPTGGFFPTNVRQLKVRMREQGIDPENIKTAYLNQILDISQYDEMAQHHFCYVEAFVYLCHKILKTPIGPRQPRDRIVFIKKVIWCLMKKFNLLPILHPAVRRYVMNNFPYYIKMVSSSGGNIPLRGHSGLFHLPNIPAEPSSGRKRTRAGNTAAVPKLFSTRLVKITMPDVNTNTTMRQIINMCAR
jgi:hypothetical protein